MPQMAPMPWMSILALTFITLMFITSYIFFTTNKNTKTSSKFTIKNFIIKW